MCGWFWSDVVFVGSYLCSFDIFHPMKKLIVRKGRERGRKREREIE